jgi:hypothetical protein
MASTYKILGQSKPAAATDTDLYTNPAGGQAIISSIAITNTSAATDTFRIYIRQDGAAAGELNALMYDSPLQSNSTTTMTMGATIDAADVITVYSTNGNITFHAFGLEIV